MRLRSSSSATRARTAYVSLPTSTVVSGFATRLWYQSGFVGAPPFEDPGLLELAQACGERRRRDAAERLLELAEAHGPVVRGPDDRDRPAPLEEVRRAADLLGNRRAATTAHARASARARAQAPRRASSPGGTTSPPSRPRGCPRGRRGCAPG